MSHRRRLSSFVLLLALAACESGDGLPTQPKVDETTLSVLLTEVDVVQRSSCAGGGSCEATVLGTVADSAHRTAAHISVVGFVQEGVSTVDPAETDAKGAFAMRWHLSGPGPHTVEVCAGPRAASGDSSCTAVTIST